MWINILEREECQRAGSINKYLELTVKKIVKTQVPQFWGFYQHSTSLLYVHLHMNWKKKKKLQTYSFIVKITKQAPPPKAYKYSESIYHLSETKVRPHSPLHFRMPLSFPGPETVEVSQCWCCPWRHCSHIPVTLPWAEPVQAALAGRQQPRCCSEQWPHTAQLRAAER